MLLLLLLLLLLLWATNANYATGWRREKDEVIEHRSVDDSIHSFIHSFIQSFNHITSQEKEEAIQPSPPSL
jgi:hypothetical protein